MRLNKSHIRILALQSRGQYRYYLSLSLSQGTRSLQAVGGLYRLLYGTSLLLYPAVTWGRVWGKGPHIRPGEPGRYR